MKKYYHGSQIKRMERINEVYEYVKKNYPVKIGKITKRFSFITDRTIKEYLKVLIDMNKIEVNDVGKFVVTN